MIWSITNPCGGTKSAADFSVLPKQPFGLRLLSFERILSINGKFYSEKFYT